MKKFFLSCLIVFSITPVFADVFFAPEWNEFCPKQYANVSTSRMHLTSSGRYWSDRRKAFEKRLEKCNSLNKDLQSACYAELRNIENSASQLRAEQVRNSNLNQLMINSMF